MTTTKTPFLYENDGEEEAEAPAVPVEKTKNYIFLPVLGIILLVVGAFAGHGGISEDKTRETLFIVCLIAGVILSVLGLYMMTRKQKED